MAQLIRLQLEFTLPASFSGTTGDALRALAAYLRENPDEKTRDDRERDGDRWREDDGEVNGRVEKVFRGVALKKVDGVWRVWQGRTSLR